MRFLRIAALLALFFFSVEVIHTSTPIVRGHSRTAQAKSKSSKNEFQKLSKAKKQYKIKATEENDDDSDFITACRATLPITLPVLLSLTASRALELYHLSSPDQVEGTLFRPPLSS